MRATWKGIAPYVLDEAGVRAEDDLLHVPYRTPAGEEHNVRVVASSGKRWWLTSGKGQIPFGLEALPNTRMARYLPALLCEGESCTLAARQAFGGDLVLAFGLPGAKSWQPEWERYFRRFPLLYLATDADDAGRWCMWKVLADLPWARPVRLPEGKDLRDVLQGEHGREQALELFAAADRETELRAAWELAPDLTALRALLGNEVPRAA